MCLWLCLLCDLCKSNVFYNNVLIFKKEKLRAKIGKKLTISFTDETSISELNMNPITISSDGESTIQLSSDDGSPREASEVPAPLRILPARACKQKEKPKKYVRTYPSELEEKSKKSRTVPVEPEPEPWSSADEAPVAPVAQVAAVAQVAPGVYIPRQISRDLRNRITLRPYTYV